MQLQLSNVTDSSAELISVCSSSSSRFTKLVQRFTLMQMLFTSKGKASIEGSMQVSWRLTWGPSRESRRAEILEKTCCTVSPKGSTVMLRIWNRSTLSTAAKAVALVAKPAIPLANTGLLVIPTRPCNQMINMEFYQLDVLKHGTSSKESCASHHWHDITWCAQLGQDPCL